MIAGRLVALLLAVACSTRGQQTVFLGQPIRLFQISNVSLTGPENLKGTPTPQFVATIKNVSGFVWDEVQIGVVIIKKDGTMHRFFPEDAIFPKYSAHLGFDLNQSIVVHATFQEPYPYNPLTVDRIGFFLTRGLVGVGQPGFHFSGVLSKDPGCLKDLVGIRALEGIELRKKVLEFQQLGCGEAQDFVRSAEVLERSTVVVKGGKISIAKVTLGDDDRFVHSRLHLPPATGWVFVSELKPENIIAWQEPSKLLGSFLPRVEMKWDTQPPPRAGQ